MKYFNIVIASIIFICTATPPALMPERLTVTGIDFSRYTDKGFLFTIDKYLYGYERIGIVEVDYAPQAYTERKKMDVKPLAH